MNMFGIVNYFLKTNMVMVVETVVVAAEAVEVALLWSRRWQWCGGGEVIIAVAVVWWKLWQQWWWQWGLWWWCWWHGRVGLWSRQCQQCCVSDRIAARMAVAVTLVVASSLVKEAVVLVVEAVLVVVVKM